MTTPDRIALLGIGAIDASVARALYFNQFPFTLLVRDKKHQGDLFSPGIRYRAKDRTSIVLGDQVQVLSLTAAYNKARSQIFDYIFLGMEIPHLKEAERPAKSLLAKGGRIRDIRYRLLK